MSSMKCIHKCGGKILMENLYRKSVNNVELEVREIGVQILNWIEATQDKLLWLQ